MVKRVLKTKVMPLMSFLVGIIITLFIIFLVILHTDFFAHTVGRMLSRYLFSGTPFSLRIEELGGNPLKQLSVKGLKIRYSGRDFSFDILRIDEIHCRYGIFSLTGDNPALDEVILLNPHLWIKPDTSGVNIIPSSAGAGRGGLPELSIGRFVVQGGQIILQERDKANAVRNIAVKGELRLSEHEVSIRVEEGSGDDLGRGLVLKGLKGDINWIDEQRLLDGREIKKGRLFLKGFHIELERSDLTIDGIVNTDSMSVLLKVRAEPMVIEEIARLVNIETSRFGELQGTVVMKGVPDSLNIKGIVKGIFSGYALSDLNVDFTICESQMLMNHYRGGFNGAYIEGEGTYVFREPEVLSLDLDARHLNLAEGFFPGRSVPESRLNGKVRFTYLPSDSRIVFSMDLDEGHLQRFPFDQAVFSGTYFEDSLYFDRILMIHPSHTVSSRGYIAAGNEMKFFIDIECERGDTIFPYFGIEEYRADLEVNGVLEGSPDSWELRSSGRCTDFGYKNMFVTGGEVKLAVEKLDVYHVYFDLDGDSCFIDPLRFSGVELSLEYSKGVAGLKRIRLERGGLDMEMRGDIRRDEDLTTIDLSEVSLNALGEKWISGGKFNILLSDTAVEFEDLQLHSRLGAMYLDCRLDRNREWIAGTFSFQRLGLSLINRAGILTQPLDGRARGRIECEGVLSDPDLDMDITIDRGRFDTLVVDTLRLKARYCEGHGLLDSLIVSSSTGHLRINGEVEGINLQEFYRERGRALHDGLVRLEVYCGRLYLGPFLPLAGRLPFSNGMFTGNLLLSGTAAHPKVAVEGMIDELETRSFRIPSVGLKAKVEHGKIEVAGTIDVSSGSIGTLTGTVPILEKDWFYSLDEERPLSFELQLPEGNLDRINEVTDLVAEGGGRFSLLINIGGTVEHPSMLGELRLKNANFRIAGMEEQFHGVDSWILLDGPLVSIAEMRGREGRDGSFTGSGSIVFRGWKPARYNLNFNLEEFLLASVPDIIAIVSGQLHVRSRMEEGRDIPLLSGSLVVNRAEVYYDLGDFGRSEPKGTMEPPSWIAAVDLDVPGNTWLKTPDANVELGGKVTVHRNRRGVYMRGELNLIRGWYNIYNNKFRVKSGKLQFVHAESFRPVVDIEAETRDPEGRSIFLDLAWHQDDVEPRLSLHHEDPGYSETDIWKMLGGGVVGSVNGEGTSWDARSTAQNLAANYIERMLNSQMEGVTIELESMGGAVTAGGAIEEKETMIAIGKYFSEGLYVKYKQGLSISTARQIDVEYRISDLFLLRSEIIKYSEKVLHGQSRRSTDEINVDIKLRWEF